VYAQGFYVVSPGVVNMVIIFDYLDRGQYYAKLLRRGGEELEREISSVWENMQRFMDEEIVRINGQRVRPVIHDVYIALRGGPTRPYITFIGSFPAPLREGENLYENYYEEEVAGYDYEAVWVLPEGAEVFEWFFGGEVETSEPNILRVVVAKGTHVGGREYIRFRWRPGGGTAEQRG